MFHGCLSWERLKDIVKYRHAKDPEIKCWLDWSYSKTTSEAEVNLAPEHTLKFILGQVNVIETSIIRFPIVFLLHHFEWTDGQEHLRLWVHICFQSIGHILSARPCAEIGLPPAQTRFGPLYDIHIQPRRDYRSDLSSVELRETSFRWKPLMNFIRLCGQGAMS